MSADAAAESGLDADLAGGYGYRGVVEFRCGVDASGAADEQLALILRVEVDQDAAGEEVRFKGEGSVESGLLRGGEEALYPAVGQFLVLQHGQLGSYAYAAVGSESGVLGYQPSVLHHCLDGVLGEIVLDPAVLLADHVGVALEDEGRGVLPAGGGGYGDEDIAGLIGPAVHAAVGGKLLEVSDDVLLVSRFARDGHNLAEVGENLC